MVPETILGAAGILAVLNTIPASLATVSSQSKLIQMVPVASFAEQKLILATHGLDLTNRLPNEYGNQVFADNILLTAHYIKGDVDLYKLDTKRSALDNIDWEAIRRPFEARFILKPGQVFAFHDTVLPEFKQDNLQTTNAHFIASEGYKPLAGLVGNGVCHLASLINWVASDAGLEVISKVNHDFYPVPGVPREYGTSIRYNPNGGNNSPNQNLYIKNNFSFPVAFSFMADNKSVWLSIVN